ncbi:hypothetical protein phiCbK_080 [Caulobacter phage phiCbK]|uniref:Uncharacterized protein n=5 Tax=Viruses TaxID=10239 RepID=K4JTJ3_9CAUD|nr:hypothetical protein D865_gp177 [Caulobacter phage phiCbK]ARB14462.1 hypothetical protein Ccr5_gp242 [Caulobacter phage Ccr5]ARB15154.1 hypothetical protein Ccr32_gp236 [Caulobacter phage Ccr32]ARB15488.1 hypothetical protein Ccr34_gp246 [Caulobacter phage Ccr34]AFO71594.1 hypothetical protein phiCbK_080 [Caulobacter phage phiCbK]AFU87073.1 hypothetical protein CbK_gp241 [Caulobacter phage phiCbK]
MPLFELSVTAIHRDTVTVEADSEAQARARILEGGYSDGGDVKSVVHDIEPEIEIVDVTLIEEED